MKKFFKEFGDFIKKGNVLDLAVGLIIGTAFNAIVKSLVNDVIMPFIGLMGGKNVAEAKFELVPAVVEAGVETTPWGKVKEPSLALESFALYKVSKFRFFIFYVLSI